MRPARELAPWGLSGAAGLRPAGELGQCRRDDESSTGVFARLISDLEIQFFGFGGDRIGSFCETVSENFLYFFAEYNFFNFGFDFVDKESLAVVDSVIDARPHSALLLVTRPRTACAVPCARSH